MPIFYWYEPREKDAYLHINVPSILPRLLEVAQRSLDALADHTRVTGRFARESSENFRQPLRRRALVRECLHEGTKTEHGSVTSKDQTVLLLCRRRSAAGGAIAVLRFSWQWVLDEQVGEVRFELGHLSGAELER